MRVPTLAGLAVLALAFAVPAAAQEVEGGIVVRSGPVQGHVIVNPQPERRVVVVDREEPRVIVVDRWEDRRWRGHAHERNWWRRAGYRPVRVYYVDGRFYDRWQDEGRPARVVVIYERGGRYYDVDDDDRYERHDRGDHDDRGRGERDRGERGGHHGDHHDRDDND